MPHMTKSFELKMSDASKPGSASDRPLAVLDRSTPRCSISPAAWPDVECSPQAPKPASHQGASGNPFFSKLGYCEWKMP